MISLVFLVLKNINIYHTHLKIAFKMRLIANQVGELNGPPDGNSLVANLSLLIIKGDD